MSETPRAGDGDPVPPAETDFLARRARERSESRRRAETEQQRLETKLLAPLRELRPEWDAAWADLWGTLASVWRPWLDPASPGGEPDPAAVAAALLRVGRAVTRHDEITAGQPPLHVLPPDVPKTFAGRLAWVEGREAAFSTDPPVLAAALVRSALAATAGRVADRVRLLLGEPDDRPAFGWLPFIRDVLWPTETFMDPADPVYGRNWPDRRRVRIDDMSRLKYLLRPSERPLDLDRLFPAWRTSPAPERPRKTITAADRVRVVNHLERVLAAVPEPYPSGPPAERDAALRRWREAHGEKDAEVPSVAGTWRGEFVALGANLHATTGGWPPADPAGDDFARVAQELLERGARVWEGEWVFRRQRTSGNVPERDREAAAHWVVEDGGWMRDALEQMLYATPERFDRFKDAVRQAVENSLSPEPRPRPDHDAQATEASGPQEETVGAAVEPQSVAGGSGDRHDADPPSVSVVEGDSTVGSDTSPEVPPTPPPFDRLFPNYAQCQGFRDRIAVRFCTEPCPPALPPCYRDGPTLPPRDLRLEWFEALGAALAWERTAGLFTFRGDVVGGFEDLIQLEGWGRMLLRPFVERPEYAHVANVLVLDRSPGVRLVNPRFGSLTAGADRGVPVLDRRTDPGEWQPPWEPNPGWEPERLRPHVLDEVDALRFCRDVAATLAEGEDLAPFLARCALVYRAPGDHLRPGAVLRRLIDSIWETIRDVSIRDRLTTPSPPRPPSTAPVLDQFHAAFDALGNWLRETRRLHPDYVDEAYARMGELATGPVCAVTECEPGQPEDWRAAVDRLVAGIRCDRPRDVDPALADAFEAVAVAVRECSRLVAAAPYLWDRPDDYRELAAAAGEAVGRARGAAWAVDIRLRRAGEPNAVLAALQDALDIRALGRVDSNGIRPVV